MAFEKITVMSAQGLKFEGYPNDTEEFCWIMAQNGCHPKAAQRILDRIKEKGYDLLTISASIQSGKVCEALKPLGVTVSAIQPLEDWENRFKDGA